MAEKIQVGKKKKIIAGALAGAVVVTGVGVGVGLGLNQGEQLPDRLVEFHVDDSGIQTVYTTDGQAVDVENLVPGQTIVFPTPETTYIGEGDARQYFVGWATRREASVPTHYVGEETITVSKTTQSFYAVYMSATTSSLTFSDNEGVDDHYTVAYNGRTTSAEGIVVVPNVYKGKPVKAITARYGLSQASLIQRLIIAEGIEEIGENAFYNCINLKSVVFTKASYNYSENVSETLSISATLYDSAEEQALTTIGANAFAGCASIKNFSIPSTVTTIGATAFKDCTSLEAISIPKSVETLGNEVFSGCSALESCEFEEGTQIAQIPEQAFYKAGLKSFTLPKSVKDIAYLSFGYCENMEVFNFEEGSLLEHIGSQALRNIAVTVLDMRTCENLTQIATDSKGDSAVFAVCPNLKEIYFSQATTTIGNTVNILAFNASLEVAVLPANMEGTLVYSFTNCPKLKEIEIPAGITKISTKCFMNCYSLERVAFAKGSQLADVGYASWNSGNGSFMMCYSLKEIGEVDDNGEIPVNRLPNQENFNLDVGMFANCYALESYDLTGLTKISASAFQYCGIKNLVIPASVTTIEDRALWWMGQLESVTINTNGAIKLIGDIFEYVSDNHTGDVFYDMNGNKYYDEGDILGDYNGNGIYDAEVLIDANNNGKYDDGEEFMDANNNGKFDYNSPTAVMKSLTIGENVSSIIVKNADNTKPTNYFGRQTALETITFEGTTAPTLYLGNEADEANRVSLELFLRARIGNTSGDTTYTIVVPESAVDTYKTAYADYADNIIAG